MPACDAGGGGGGFGSSTRRKRRRICGVGERVGERVAAAANASCGPRLLATLACDTDAAVRSAVAANDACCGWLLGDLSGDTETVVRSAVAANRSCPPPALAVLAADPDPDVSTAAAANPSLDDGTRREMVVGRWWQRAGAAANPLSSRRQMEVLAADFNWRVREAAAANPGCGPGLLAGLLSDNDARVSGSGQWALMATLNGAALCRSGG